MGTKASFSPLFITCCLILIFILFTTTSEGFSARNLEAIPPIPNGNMEETKNQSKGEIHGSTSRRDGSAAGNSTPTGTVQLPPPTAVTKIAYASNTAYSPPEYPDNPNYPNNPDNPDYPSNPDYP